MESRHTLPWWAWKLRQEEGAQRESPAFVELEVAEQPQVVDAGVEILLASGRRLLVRPGFGPQTLARAVAALERGC